MYEEKKMLKPESEVESSVEETSGSLVEPSVYTPSIRSEEELSDEHAHLTVNIGPARQEQKSWWRRAGAKVISWLNPVNAVSFLTTVIGSVSTYFSTQSAASDPGYYGIDPHHADEIQQCLELNLPADSKYEGMAVAFQNGWFQLPIMVCVVLSVTDLGYDIQHRHKNAMSGLRHAFGHKEQRLVRSVTAAAIHEAKRAADEGYMRTEDADYKKRVQTRMQQIYMKSQVVSRIDDTQVSEDIAIKRFNRDYWYGFFRDSRGKFSFPYKWIVHPSFCAAILYYVFGGRHFTNQYEQDIPIEFARLMHDNATNWEDEACLNTTAMHDAGDANLENAVICGLLIPALAMGSIVTAMGIRKAYRALTAHRTTGERVMLHDEHSLEDYGAVERTPIPLIEPV